MEKVWFITGSSRGFGRELVRAALEAGDVVAATARRPEQLADLVDRYGERVLPLALDVTDAAAAVAAIAAARDRFGRIDVVVNNAGYANVAPIETGDDDDFRTQFETNFWGVYNVSKAAIPVLREQQGGLIIQFSSMGGGLGRFLQGVEGAGADVAVDDTKGAEGGGGGELSGMAGGCNWRTGHWRPHWHPARRISRGAAIICQSATRRRKLPWASDCRASDCSESLAAYGVR